MRKNKQSEALKPRNRHAINPLLKKGGAHIKSKSSQRSKEKQKLRRRKYDKD